MHLVRRRPRFITQESSGSEDRRCVCFGECFVFWFLVTAIFTYGAYTRAVAERSPSVFANVAVYNMYY